MAKSWSGPLAPIGKPTGDGRMFADGAITNRDFPLPLRFQRLDNPGHAGAVVVGRILGIEYRDGEIFGKGDWLDPKTTPEVTEAQELSAKGVIGPSVDLDDATVEKHPVSDEAEQELAKAGEDCGCGSGVEHSTGDVPMMAVVTAGRISGATLVQIPAFAEVKALSLSDDEYAEEVDQLTASVWAGTASTGDPVLVESEQHGEEDLHAYLVQFSDDGETAEVVYDDGSYAVVAAWRVGPAREDERDAWTEALTAAAARVCPPSAWFNDPKFTEKTPITITDDGRVFGHLADWQTCHIGFARHCEPAPRSKTDYAYFHTGAVETAEGDLLPVGRITLGTGHANLDLDFSRAAEHYDNSGTAIAVVRAGEDSHGIWVAGSLVPEATPERVAEFRRSPLSGDWRSIGGRLELVAALAVNTAGFPVTRSRVASGQPLALVAGGFEAVILDDDGLDFTAPGLDVKSRKQAAEAGQALPDGSYPMRTVRELRKAIQAYGRSKNKDALRRLIMKRARELDREDLIPDQWRKNPDSYAETTRTSNTAEGVTINVVIDGDMMGRTLEDQFKKMKRRRDMYAEAESTFALLEASQAEERVEEAAALLAVIGGE